VAKWIWHANGDCSKHISIKQELSSTVSELEMQVKDISQAQEENAKAVETISFNAENLKEISEGLLTVVAKFKT